jgi:hypothetical protein
MTVVCFRINEPSGAWLYCVLFMIDAESGNNAIRYNTRLLRNAVRGGEFSIGGCYANDASLS